jgi:8-oxo-dGTP diphosphatase
MPYQYDYPKANNTVDMIILRENPALVKTVEVLLIKRRDEPFKDCWALPGGYVEENESLEAAAARELLEETGLSDVKLKQFGAFGDPNRDPRGWTITVAFAGWLEGNQQAKAGDDAKELAWFGLDRFPRMAFDHEKIINQYLED